MSPNTYFRSALLLPLVLPPLIWLLFKNMATAVALMSVLMAGLPYLVFAAYLWVRLGRLPESMAVPRTILLAPVLFLLPAGVAFMAWSGYTSGFDRYLPLSLFVFIPFAFFIAMLGYAYVGMSIVVFNLLTRAGYVRLPSV